MNAAFPRLREAGWWLLLLAITLYMTLSSLTLAWLGVPYDLPGGNPLVKFHPGTWVLVLALLVALAGCGHPLRVLLGRLWQAPLLAVYLGAMVIVAVWSVSRNGTGGAAFIVDTLWMPGIALLVLGLYGPARHRRLLRWMVALLVLNALVALAEYAARQTLVPRFAADTGLVADAGYFRASALLGHPLANAMITLALMPAAMLLAGWRRWAALGITGLALLAFGSRASLAALLTGAATALALTAALQTARGRYSYLQVTGGLLALMLAATAVVGTVLASGLGERIFANLTWDNSANVRLVAPQALDHLDDFEWWVGVPPARIDEIALRLGLDPRFEAIENFWIVLLMQFGLIGFIPFVVGLGAGLLHVWRQAMPPLQLALPVYLLVASGANTLAAKSVSLTLLFVVMAASAAWRLPAAGGRPAVMPAAAARPWRTGRRAWR